MGPPLSLLGETKMHATHCFELTPIIFSISRTRIATTTTAHDNLTTHTKHINPTTFHRPVIAYVPDNIPVLLDNKRGDIGSTAVAYAESAYQQYKADAVTVNPYMGTDSVAPFTNDPTKGCFVLCKTSNPSSTELQELMLDSGEAVFERTARLASEQWNTNNNVGLVVGATDVDALERARKAAPSLWILAPGIGSQGGDLVQATTKGKTIFQQPNGVCCVLLLCGIVGFFFSKQNTIFFSVSMDSLP